MNGPAVVVVMKAASKAARSAGLTMTQLLVISTLDGGELKVGEVKKALPMSLEGVSSMLERLGQDGLVSRRLNPEDRRSWIMGLTEKGRAALVRAEKAITQPEGAALAAVA